MSNASCAAVGWSADAEAFAAGRTAARMALQRLRRGGTPGAIVFGSSWFDQTKLLEGVLSAGEWRCVVGGSTAGEITPHGPTSHSCVVLALTDQELAMSVGAGRDVEHEPRLAGYQAAQQALRQFNGRMRSGVLLFGDGLLTGYAEVLRGIQEVVGTSTLVTGGLMADDLRFRRTYQYYNDQALSHAAVCLLLGGSCALGVGMEHGFSPISKPRRVTKASANVLYALDGHPASSVYEEYFGTPVMDDVQQAGFTRQMIAYPLGIQLDSTNQFLLRNVMAFGADGSLVCSGEIPQESWVQLMIGSKQLAIDAAAVATRQAIQQLPTVRCLLIFDSVARKRLLGRDAAEEVACIRDIVGPDVPLAGCYTYGEQAPLGAPSPYGLSSVQTGACLIVALGP